MADALERQFDFISRVADLTKDHEDLLEVLNSGAKLGHGLRASQRKRLDCEYQKLILAKLSRWRIVSKIKYCGDDYFVALAKEYLERLGNQIVVKCDEILVTLDKYLCPSSDTGEAGVFYFRMMGDYYSYVAEVSYKDFRELAASQSQEAYEAATAIAESDLSPADPLRLGLALNFSVFLYEIIADTERATYVAKKAIKDATPELHSLDLRSYKKCTQIIRKLKKKSDLWTADSTDDDKECLQPPPRPAWFDEVDFAGELNTNLKDLRI